MHCGYTRHLEIYTDTDTGHYSILILVSYYTFLVSGVTCLRDVSGMESTPATSYLSNVSLGAVFSIIFIKLISHFRECSIEIMSSIALLQERIQ